MVTTYTILLCTGRTDAAFYAGGSFWLELLGAFDSLVLPWLLFKGKLHMFKDKGSTLALKKGIRGKVVHLQEFCVFV